MLRGVSRARSMYRKPQSVKFADTWTSQHSTTQIYTTFNFTRTSVTLVCRRAGQYWRAGRWQWAWSKWVWSKWAWLSSTGPCPVSEQLANRLSKKSSASFGFIGKPQVEKFCLANRSLTGPGPGARVYTAHRGWLGMVTGISAASTGNVLVYTNQHHCLHLYGRFPA